VLADSEIEHIHERSLDLLERVGIDYQSARALEVLERHGCRVDYERTWASLPRDFVEWAIERAPRVVRLEARDPARSVVLDGRRAHHTCDSQGTRALDFETGERLPSKEASLRRGLLFADAMDKLDIVNIMVAATDVPAHVRVVRHFEIGFEMTSKPVRMGVLHADMVPYLVDLARAATGEDRFRPIFSTVHCSISPLMHDGAMTEACMELAALGVPILLHPMPLAGATSPLPLAGTLLQHNVEVLSGLALFQAVAPGAPLVYAAGPSQLDMVTWADWVPHRPRSTRSTATRPAAPACWPTWPAWTKSTAWGCWTHRRPCRSTSSCSTTISPASSRSWCSRSGSTRSIWRPT
jgi:trimethylamine--corrinoid protein Co-methyltransferase